MNGVHMRSVWIGAHGTLLVVALMLIPISWWSLFTVATSGLCLWANLQAIREESERG